MLLDKDSTVLSTRPVVASYRNGIKWNPQDETCVACKIVINRQSEGTTFSMDGHLFSVKSK